MLALADSPPSTAKQLLTTVQQHVATLNAAVQHLPYAPHWAVSAAVRRSAKQLQQLLQEATASGYQDSSSCQASQPGPQDLSGQAAGLTASSALAGAVAANAQGENHHEQALQSAAAAAGVGPAVMIGGRLVAAGVLLQARGPGVGQMPRRRRRHDGEHREKLIKKFSAKTQVRGPAGSVMTLSAGGWA
jgi:hypothetical protein